MTELVEEVQNVAISPRAQAAYARLTTYEKRDILFLDEVREILGITRERARQLLSEGKLLAASEYKREGKWARWVIEPQAVKDFIAGYWANPKPKGRKPKLAVIEPMKGGDAAN